MSEQDQRPTRASTSSSGSWSEAYAELIDADPERLGGVDLERLADAAWWLGRVDEALGVWQRAHARLVAEEEAEAAARVAVRLAFEHGDRDEGAVAAGWLRRAEADVEGRPVAAVHGSIALAVGIAAVSRGDVETLMHGIERALEIARTTGDRDLEALARHGRGRALIFAGHVDEGLALLDEVMTSVVAGELSPHVTGVIYCSVLDACLGVADLRRATEWNEAARRWCETLPPETPFTSRCRLLRAQVASLRGSWSEAEREAALVFDADTSEPGLAANALYETGEVRRRIGKLRAAEDAYARASELGRDPQPGLALLRLAQGRGEVALAAIRSAVASEPFPGPGRAARLAALVEIALAVGDREEARRASEELAAIASGAEQVVLLRAMAAESIGAVRLADGEPTGAAEALRGSIAAWRELRLPYETARARSLLGDALAAAGDVDGGRLELAAARSAFDRLGAVPDVQALDERIEGRPASRPGGLTDREVEVLRLLAKGLTNRQVAEALVLSEHTVGRHVQNIYAKLRVSTRAAATAFAFEHDLV